jgi:hypothetical protein
MRCCIFRSRHTARRGYAGRERFPLLLQFFVNVDCASAANLHSRCTRMKQIWSPPCARSRCSPCENE